MSRDIDASLNFFSGISFSDIERIDLKIRVNRERASIFGKVYLIESFDFRVFGYEVKISESDLPVYLEKMENEAFKAGVELRHSTTKWGWLWSLEKAMWRVNSGDLLSPHTCPACVLMESALLE